MDRDWLDGPRFVGWLELHAPEACELAAAANGYGRTHRGMHSNLGRGLARWRQGAAVSVYSADLYLTEIGLHLSLLPDDLYREKGPGVGHRPPETYIRDLAA